MSDLSPRKPAADECVDEWHETPNRVAWNAANLLERSPRSSARRAGDANKHTTYEDNNIHNSSKPKKVEAPAPMYEPKLTIAYWSIRGLAAPLRMAAFWAYGGMAEHYVTFVNYDAGDPNSPEYKASWVAAKPGLQGQNSMMNLPYIVDRELNHLHVSQSNACLYYLGRKLGLSAAGELEHTRMDQVIAETMDLRNFVVRSAYSQLSLEERQAGLPDFQKSVETYFAKFEGFMQQNGTAFCCGERLLVADLHVWELVDQLEIYAKFVGLDRGFVAKFPLLNCMYEAIKAAPELESYWTSPYYALPLNNPHATFK